MTYSLHSWRRFTQLRYSMHCLVAACICWLISDFSDYFETSFPVLLYISFWNKSYLDVQDVFSQWAALSVGFLLIWGEFSLFVCVWHLSDVFACFTLHWHILILSKLIKFSFRFLENCQKSMDFSCFGVDDE